MQFSQCSGEGNRRERGSGLGGTGRTLWRGSGSGRCKPPVQDWHSVSESVVTRERGAWRPSPKHVILGEKHHRSRGASQGSELARDHYGTPSVEQEGKLDLGETETWRPYFRAWSNPSRPSDILTRPGETDDARLDLGIFPRQHHRTFVLQNDLAMRFFVQRRAEADGQVIPSIAGTSGCSVGTCGPASPVWPSRCWLEARFCQAEGQL